MDDILVPLFLFSFLTAIIIVPAILRYRDRARLHETMRIAIERGEPMPPELIESLQKGWRTTSPYRDLRRAVIFIGVGLGLIAMGFALGQFAGPEAMYGTMSAGMIPGFIGLGFLLLWFFTRNKETA
jgi:hypothetical protein